MYPPSSNLDLPNVRWLGPGDGDSLVLLLRACYRETYSHAVLYEHGRFDELWRTGELVSAGAFDAKGELVGHTGFWRKDPLGDYVEVGLSMIHPDHRRGFKLPVGAWAAVLNFWTGRVGYIHQHTTTRHPAAQLYAARYMRARPSGWVFEYALDEVVVDLAEQPAPMHALSSSTVLGPARIHDLAVPSGAWTEWLAELIELGAPGARLSLVEPRPARFSLETFETSAGLDLRRRLVTLDGEADELNATARVELVHLPMRTREVAAAFAELIEHGYVPVCVRQHDRRCSEIVLQHLPDRSHAVTMLGEMQLLGPTLAQLAAGWTSACSRTS